MLKSYVDYWKCHDAACVGTSRIGKGRICSVHEDGTTREGPWWTMYIPHKWVTYNRKGLCIGISTFTRMSNNRSK